MSGEEFMLPCLNKKLLGIECMGCGLQRSVSLLFQGEFVAAFQMYPAIYTLILFFAFVAINTFKKFEKGTLIITILGILNVALIVGNYLIKMLFK